MRDTYDLHFVFVFRLTKSSGAPLRIPKRPKAPDKFKPVLPTDSSPSKRADISSGKKPTPKEIPAKKKANKFIKTSRPSNSSSAIGSSTEEDVEKGSSNNLGQKIKSSVEGLIKGGNGCNTSSAGSWSAVKESRKKLQASITKLIQSGATPSRMKTLQEASLPRNGKEQFSTGYSVTISLPPSNHNTYHDFDKQSWN